MGVVSAAVRGALELKQGGAGVHPGVEAAEVDRRLVTQRETDQTSSYVRHNGSQLEPRVVHISVTL